MKLILLLILALPAAALAGKQMTAKDMSMLGKIDENAIKNAEPAKPAVQAQEPAAQSKFFHVRISTEENSRPVSRDTMTASRS